MPRYKHLSVKKVELAEYAPTPRERKVSLRQVAQAERDADIQSALNEAASLSASQAIVIDLKEGQKLPTLRAAVARVLQTQPRDLKWGIRGQSIVISKGPIPRRGRRRG